MHISVTSWTHLWYYLDHFLFTLHVFTHISSVILNLGEHCSKTQHAVLDLVRGACRLCRRRRCHSSDKLYLVNGFR